MSENDKKETTGKMSATMDIPRNDGKESFDKLVSMYGVDRSVARGVRASINLPADGRMKEDDFLKALKKFTGQKPR